MKHACLILQGNWEIREHGNKFYLLLKIFLIYSLTFPLCIQCILILLTHSCSTHSSWESPSDLPSHLHNHSWCELMSRPCQGQVTVLQSTLPIFWLLHSFSLSYTMSPCLSTCMVNTEVSAQSIQRSSAHWWVTVLTDVLCTERVSAQCSVQNSSVRVTANTQQTVLPNAHWTKQHP